MGWSAQTASRGGSTYPTGTNFTGIGGAGGSSGTPETNVQFKIRVSGTFARLAANVNNAGTARSITFRKNTANGNQTIAMTDTTAGTYQDNDNTDTVAVTDLINIQSVASTAGFIPFWIRTLFKADANHATFYTVAATFNVASASTTFYQVINGFSNNVVSGAVEANAKFLIRAGGVLQNAQVVVSAARATDTLIRSRLDTGGGSADGNILITCTGGVTGTFEDTSNTDTIAAGTYINWSITLGTGSDSFTARSFGGTIVNSSAPQSDYYSRSVGSITWTGGTTDYFLPIANLNNGTTTEANVQFPFGFQVRVSNIRLYASANSLAADAQLVSRKNATNGNQSVTITHGVTGWYEDTSNTDDYSPTDFFNVALQNGTSGSLAAESMQFTGYDRTGNYIINN